MVAAQLEYVNNLRFFLSEKSREENFELGEFGLLHVADYQILKEMHGVL